MLWGAGDFATARQRLAEVPEDRRAGERARLDGAVERMHSAIDDLRWHKAACVSGWKGRVVPTYRPDAVTDPDFEGFRANVETLGALTGCAIGTWEGYLAAHRARRAFFKTMGATATDHGHHHRQDHDAEDVIEHGGADHDLAFAALEPAQFAEHAGRDADGGGGHGVCG